jgi:hypothetical protein
MEAHEQSVALTMCLGVGLILRDLDFCQFRTGEGDEISADINHIARSALNWGHYQALLSACKDILEDIEICFDDVSNNATMHVAPSPVQPASNDAHNNDLHLSFPDNGQLAYDYLGISIHSHTSTLYL